MAKIFKNQTRNNFTLQMYIMNIVILIFFLALLFKLFHIQVVKYDIYKTLAQKQHEFSKNVIPERGEIFIRDKYSDKLYPLAVNKEMNVVYAVPKDIKDKKEAAAKLSKELDMNENDIFDIINKENDPYEIIKRKVDDETANKIRNKNIEGIEISSEIVRYYPENELAANVIGFLGFKGNKRVGQYGIEGFYNSRLEGKIGFLELEKDAYGKLISFGEKNNKPPKNGENIVLTIDQTIQYIAEKKLKESIEKYDASGGNIIIMNPKSGEIVAMAQYPTYNPNEYYKENDIGVFLNSCIADVYEPGSIQKPITMAIGIDTGKISPNTTYIDEGFIKIDGWTISNYDGKSHKEQNMIQVLEQSLNTGAVFVQKEVGKSDFYKYLKKFGIDEKTGIEISGEVKGSISNLKTNSDISYATASYGQGISVTPLAMLSAISIFANDGKLMKPFIVSEFIKQDGTSEKTHPKVVRQVVSPRTANTVSAMMINVIENGQAKQAKLEGYKFAGKTGTAQIPKKDGRGYIKSGTIHTFVGFGPMPNPKFSVLIKIDEPKNVLYAANSAAPLFRELSKDLINYYNIPPTDEIE